MGHLASPKRLLSLVCTICSWLAVASAQNPSADSLLAAIERSADAEERMELMASMLYETASITEQERIEYTKTILDLAKRIGDPVLESVATAELGYLLHYNGSTLQGTELIYAGLHLAQDHENDRALGIIYNDLAICTQDPVKAREHYRTALAFAQAAGDDLNAVYCLSNTAGEFERAGQRDSALHFSQRAYELCMAKDLDALLPSILCRLAGIHYNLVGDKDIGYVYARKAMNTPFAQEDIDTFLRVHTLLARMHLSDGRPDSALYHTDLCLTLIRKGRDLYELNVYALCKDIYAGSNSDSALKYFQLYDTARREAEEQANTQEAALLQVKKEIELEKDTAERNQNIQFGIIALIVITLGIFLLIFSRTSVVGAKAIKNLSLIALLLFFEFINLLLHPFLDRITNHSPLLMLLAMAAIAGLLIPLHHRMEKLITNMLVSKNNRVRLEAARRTIEELEARQKESNAS